MIDLMKLRTFIIAAERQNFSIAAKQLNLTQPTISHHIKTLEQELGIQLINRSDHVVHLTEAGRLLLPWARKLIRQSNELQELMFSMDKNIVGQIRIACSTAAGKYILPQLSARFLKQFPAIQISILACTSEHIIHNLLNNDANLAVSSSEKIDTGIESQAFFIDQINLIVPFDHHWSSNQPIDVSEILNEKIIVRESNSGTRRVMLEEFAKHDISLDDLNIFMEIGNTEAIVNTVAAGFGIAFVSKLSAVNEIELGLVRVIPTNEFELKRKIFMVRKEIRPANRALEVFWGFINNPDNYDLISLPQVISK